MLDIIYDLLHQTAEVYKKDKDEDIMGTQSLFETLLKNFEYCVKLLGAADVTIVEKAS